MKFGYTIIYVKNVNKSLTFFEKAFGFKIRFTYEEQYGELDTGETTLAFASHKLGEANLSQGYIASDSSSKPLGIEIALVTENVEKAHMQAVSVGAISIQEPLQKPWGQIVSYVRCPDGVLVELCSPLTN